MLQKIKNHWPVILLLFALIPSLIRLIRPGYFPMHDDMQAMRLLQMDKCVKDAQIPCRWVPDMGYGYGYPQFNYYSPLPYYLMEGFHIFGFSYLDSVKAIFILSVIISAVGMYLLASSVWKSKWAGLVSSVFYVYLPYRAVDMYVRGAVDEFWALTFLPFIFYSIYKIATGSKKAILWLGLSYSALLLTHNVSVVISAPFLVLWFVFSYFQYAKENLSFKTFFIRVLIGSLWAISIAAFFLLPAWFERKYAHVETLTEGYFNYLAHFVGLRQLFFSTFWGFGDSQPGPYDDISLSVGFLHYLVPIIALSASLFVRKNKIRNTILVLIGMALVSVFMIHSKSVFIWKRISILSFVQFPWRFLEITGFLLSFAAGSIATFILDKKFLSCLVFAITLMLIFFYGSYFRTSKWINITDQEKFSGTNWDKEQTISIFDYLPVSAEFPPTSRAPEKPQILEGTGSIISGQKGTDWQRWNISVSSINSKVQIPLFYFPTWKLIVNNVETPYSYDNSLGLITTTLHQGSNVLYIKLENTPIRRFSNLLSLFAIIAIPVFLVKTKKGSENDQQI